MARKPVVKHYERAGAVGTALARRLRKQQLTPADQTLVARARVIRERRAQGWSYERIGEELGLTRKAVNGFATRGLYAICCDYLDALERGGPDAPPGAVAADKATHRGTIARLVPKALRRLEQALDAGEVDGRIVESKSADHAMDTVLEAAGLLEPEGGAVRPVIQIDTLVIQQITEGLRADEARARDATVVVPATATG